MSSFPEASKQYLLYYMSMSEVSIVVAYDKNRAVGANGDLPWKRSLPADLANFKNLTTGGSIIMGRKTFDSIGRRPLPNRENIVISSKPAGVKGVLTAVNLQSALALARYPIFIIGGGQVYSNAMSIASKIFATEVDSSFNNTDVFFPALDNSWQETSKIHSPKDNENLYPFDFVVYEKH